MRSVILSLLVLVAACGSDVSVIKQRTDNDGDGFTEEVDCDDAHATVNPDATESCDGLDNDCDGAVDDDPNDASRWYLDADGDEYGDSSLYVESCEAVPGYVANSTDCDDDDPAIHPDAPEEDCADPVDYDCDGSTGYADEDGDGYVACEDCDDGDPAVNADEDEVCDGLDNDCDGTIDEDDAIDAGTWYGDGDEDGYGEDADTLVSCAQPEGYAPLDSDCDDSDAAYNPGATEEDCEDPADYNCDGSTGYADEDGDGWAACEECDDTSAHVNPDAAETCDGVDNDCDAATDEADAIDLTTWYMDDDSDGYGDASSTAEACDAPTGYVDNDDDCDDTSAAISPADAEICDSANTDEDCDGKADDLDSSVASSGKSTWYDDDDSDGYGDASDTSSTCDLPTGYASNDDDCDDTSAAISPADSEVCANGIDDDCDDDVDEGCGLSGTISADDADAMIYGETKSDQFGASLSGGFDFDEDGVEDLVVGAPSDDDGASAAGALYLFTGDVAAGSSLATADDYMKLYGTTSYGDAGREVWAIPDLDSDGDDEIIAIGDGSATMNLVLGPSATGTATLSSAATATYTSCDEVAYAGHSNSLTGDDDWMCGWSYDSSSTGEITVYSGKSTVVATLVGESAEDSAGYALAGGEDVDGDGYDDYGVGAYGDDDAGTDAGAAYVVYAPVSASATVSLASADSKLLGDASAEYLGSSIRLADMNGDGYADALVGAVGNANNGTNAGAIYLFDAPSATTIGASTASAVIYGAAASDELGHGTASFISTGDADGDGQLDLLVGASQNDEIGTTAGQAWLFYGPMGGTVDLSSGSGYDVALQGSEAGDYFGQSGTLASDLNNDGLDDIIIGAPYGDGGGSSNVGAVYVFYGK